MHASGHALLAGAGGALARSLGGGAGPMDARSIQVLRDLGRGDPMLGLAIAGLIAALAKLVGGVSAGWAEARIAGEVGAELRLEVLDGIHGVTSLRAPRQGDHGEAQTGPHIAKLASLTTHVSDVEKGVALGVFAEMRAVLQLAPLAVLLVVLAPRLAGSAAFALVSFAVLVMVARRALKRNHARAARETEALLGAADEAVRHADLWATYGAEGRIRAHVAQLGRTIIKTSSRLRARSALLSHTSELLGALALVLTLALIGAGTIGGVDRGALVPFAIVFFMAYKPLRELVDGRLVRARADDALVETTERTTGRADREVAPAAAARAWPLATLTVNGLVGRHGKHAPLSFVVAPGQVLAIVGPTGIGKTSLLRALLGLDAPRGGAIAWGEEDLSKSGVGPNARPFAWVPQDAPVLGDTLVANVVLGLKEQTSFDDAAQASRVLGELGADGLVASVGDAHLVTDRPVSGGERQWIAVGRALATRLPVLLLDEPTSSLDGAAQERMLAAIASLRGKRTVVIVTHRPEPLAIADVVVRVSSDGEDAQHRSGSDDDTLGSKELSIEDVGAAALEAQLELPRERVDVPGAE
jgi:ABC-type multidrug transport system fused ATPase/permease subunit